MGEKALLYGIAPVQQCLSFGRRKCHQLFLKDGVKSPRLDQLAKLSRSKGISVERIDGGKLAAMAGTKQHQGVVLSCSEIQTLGLDEFLDDLPRNGKQLLVAMDQIEDPQNLGAVIRSAAFLGAAGLLTLKKHASPLSPTVSKASAGALEHFPVIQIGNLSECLQRLKKEGFIVAGASGDDTSIPYQEMPLSDLTVLVLGNEGQGLRKLTRKRCDFLIRISGSDRVESLNVSAAAAILIQHLMSSI